MFGKYLLVFIISMVPMVELRGAIPVAVGWLELNPLKSIAVCAVGNMLPVPVIYFYARKFLLWGLDKPYIGGVCRFFHEKGEIAGQRLSASKWGRFGMIAALTAFVGIPVPGTGAWTGTLGASFLGMGTKETAFSVSLGVLIAALIMAVLSVVGIHVFGL